MSGHMYHDSCDTNDDKHQPPTPPTDENVSPRDPICECGQGCVMPHQHRHVEREAFSPALDVERLARAMYGAAGPKTQARYPWDGDGAFWVASAAPVLARLAQDRSPEPSE